MFAVASSHELMGSPRLPVFDENQGLSIGRPAHPLGTKLGCDERARRRSRNRPEGAGAPWPPKPPDLQFVRCGSRHDGVQLFRLEVLLSGRERPEAAPEHTWYPAFACAAIMVPAW